MSLLSSLFGLLTGNGNLQNQLMQSVGNIITQHGGIDGIVQKFTAHGLGDQAQQWVGTGPNPPITGDHIQQVLGNDVVQKVAGHLGIDTSHAANGIAALLPAMIDKLTPQGQSVSGSALTSGLANLLKGGVSGLNLGDLAELIGK
jgi:uncharacterized protein YidB (DUF937 family)